MSESMKGTPNQATAGNGPPSRQHNPRPGTPPEMYNWLYEQLRSPPTPPGSVHSYSSINSETQPKCSSCCALGCELYSSRKVMQDLTLKLVYKNVDFDKLNIQNEKLTFDNENITIANEKLETEKLNLEERLKGLELSEGKIHGLQLENKELKESINELQKKLVTLEYKYCALDQQCSILRKEKEQMLMAQHQLLQNFSRNASQVSVTKINTDSSESEESSSKSSYAPRNRYERMPANQTGSDLGQTGAPVGDQAQKNSTELSRARHTPTTSHTDSAWNNQQIRPNRNGPRPNPQRSSGDYNRSQAGNRPSVDRPNQGSSAHSEDPSVNTERIGEKPKSNYADVVKEIKKDLFTMSDEYSLAHCVGSDFIMSSGVAVNFRKTFRHVPELLQQNKNPGQVAHLDYSGRHIYYLVTKLASTGKPTWDDFEKAVIEWSGLCVEHKVTKIAIPKIGCGRDQLDWNRVRSLLNEQFSSHGIEIIVCIIDQEAVPPQKWNLKLNHRKEPLSLLDHRECALVFIASKDRFINASIDRLARKYGFTSDYSTSQLGLGSIYQYSNKATGANLFGLVVKEKHTDPISFSHVGTCLQALRRAVKKMSLYYMGLEAFDDPKFPIVTRKLWTAVIDTFFVEEIEVYFCWPDDVKEKNWEERA